MLRQQTMTFPLPTTTTTTTTSTTIKASRKLLYLKNAYSIQSYQLPSKLARLIRCLLIVLIINHNVYFPVFSQLSGREKTMEQFLDRLLHESVYDKRIRPFYTDNKSKFYFILG